MSLNYDDLLRRKSHFLQQHFDNTIRQEKMTLFLIEFKYIREKAVHSESTRKRNISKVQRTAREQLAEYMTDDRLKETEPSQVHYRLCIR